MTPLPPIPVNIRSFEFQDQSLCKRLYMDGLLIGGKIAANDTALDIDDINQGYLAGGGHFWVALNPQGELVGMIGVQQHERGEGEVRRLRVRRDHLGRGIGSSLLETAIKFCRDRQYLKVTLDTYIDQELAMKLFEKHKFKHSRTREVNEKTLLYFYYDLYSTDQLPKRNGGK